MRSHFLLLGSVALFAMGCGSGSKFDPDAGGPDLDATEEDPGIVLPPSEAGDAVGCVGLECQIPSCSTSEGTTISGTVFAPNGLLPLYNVIVYVNNTPVQAFADGITCDKCGVLSSGSPVVVGLTDSKGNFKLTNTPAGTNIPLVMQIGKWRRQIVIPEVKACIDNKVSKKVGPVEELTRLPKKRTEGDMPKIAITTGGCDRLACIMPKIGIDPTEYSAGPTSASTKPKTAISFYYGQSGGQPFSAPPATPFWNDYNQMKNFDMTIFSCECQEASATKNQTSYDAVQKYMENGGRIFTTDFQYTWYKYSKDTNLNKAPWSWPGGAPLGVSPFLIDQTFAKGKALAEWLYYVSSTSPYNTQTTQPPVKGQFPLQVPFDNIHAYDKNYGTSWVNSGGHPRFVTMNMPSAKPADQQCGKGVHLDAHISVGDQVTNSFPTGCNTDAKETELATVFFIFDLSSCIQKDTDDVVPPTIPK